MSKIKVIGIDLAKRVMQLCVMDEFGKVRKNAKLSPAKVSEFLANTPSALVAMESCSMAHYWGRLAQSFGHEVRLIPPQHVKAFRRVHKSDAHDALAICEAAQRPDIHPVPIKSIEQQNLSMLVSVRDGLISERTAKSNQIRGIAREFGLHFGAGIEALLIGISQLSIETDLYSAQTTLTLGQLAQDLVRINQRVNDTERALIESARRQPAFDRLQKIPGVGPIIAASLIAKAGDGSQFKNGRHMAAWVGLVPRQNGTGGKVQLGHITKNGDRYLRRQLVHGARTVIRWLDRQQAPMQRWLEGLVQRRGRKRAIVAYANKITRLAWRALTHDEPFQIERAFGPPANA
jgi:transposase